MNEWLARLTYFFETGLYLKVAAALGFLMLILFVIRLQRNTNKVDFQYMILNSEGKVDGKKVYEMGAFAVSTWAFCYLTLDGKLAEWYFTAYMLTWTGNQLLNRWLNKDPAPIPPPTQVTVETPDGPTVKVNQ